MREGNTLHPIKKINSEYLSEIEKNIIDVSFDNVTRILYSTDASIYQIVPVGVIYPKHIDEIIAAIEISKKYDIPVLPRGNGTSLAGQAVGEALIINFTRHLNKLIEVNKKDKYAILQPGAILGELNLNLEESGLMFGPDPASAKRATIGGVVGNNSTGAHFIEYGMTSDNLLGIDLVLDDGKRIYFGENDGNWDDLIKMPGRKGEIYKKVHDVLNANLEEIKIKFPKSKRNVSGYALNLISTIEPPNLAKLISGSEGTLGIITEAKIKLIERPNYKLLVIIQYSSLADALRAVPEILESKCSAIELMDNMLINLSKQNSEYKKMGGFVDGTPDALLLVELSGLSEIELKTKLKSLKTKVNRSSANENITIINDHEIQENIWKIRSSGLGILMSNPGDSKPIPFIEDVSVPVEHLADYANDVKGICAENGIHEVAFYAHASSGCLHVRPNIDLKTSNGLQQLRKIAESTFDIVAKYNGANSGEHGDGLVRSEFLEKMYGAKLISAFKEIKKIFDPENIFNPGKIVNPHRMDDVNTLRYQEKDIVTNKGITILQDFYPHAGLQEAINMCSGSGECLNLTGGVMCPSFQATKEEINSTRGRTNALRSFLSGYYQHNQLNPEQIFQVLDLCLSCQACKVECPSSVDMAKIKAEFLQMYYSSHRPSIRTSIFGNIDQVNKILQRTSRFSNWMINKYSNLINKVLKISKFRKLPNYSQKKFSDMFLEDQNIERSKGREVVLFVDSFTEFNLPELGQKAVKLLQLLGYTPIIVEKQVCCGRSAYSKGFLDKAKKLAVTNIQALKPFAEQGIPIVGLEPSCLSMFVNEYLSLAPGEDAKLVSSKIKMIEEFVFEEIKTSGIELNFDKNEKSVLYHGHCQQKANFGTDAVIQFLKLNPKLHVELADTGCCGMAGSFGYEEEHYNISMKIAEISLDSLMDSTSKTIICSSGTSCREQIDHIVDKKPIHPIELFVDSLDM